MIKILFPIFVVSILSTLQLQQAHAKALAKEFAPNQWHLISVPCADESMTVGEVFAGLPGSGNWALHHYSDGAYITIDDVTDKLIVGAGYWFNFQADISVRASVNCDRYDGASQTVPAGSFALVGNPYNDAVTVGNSKLDGSPVETAIEAKAISSLWVYRNGEYVALTSADDRIKPWEGFWLGNRQTKPALLKLGAIVKAFPTAEGAGASALGGRGGKVMQVTNLNDSGSGSLRACAESTGARTCVFRLGGTITLEKEITVESPFLTIAGQTAPGGGITLRMNPNVSDEALNIKTHDIVVRFIRLRPGGSSVRKDNQRGLTIANQNPGNVYNVVIDHCSIGWSSDETAIAWYDARDITFQWSIFHEGFSCASHTKDCSVSRSKGLLVGSEATAVHPASGDMSIHHNIFAHHGERGPRLANGGVGDVVNNVAYNMRYSASQSTNRGSDPARRNYVGNLYIKGPSSESDYQISPQQEVERNAIEIYIKGNIGPLRTDNSMDEQLAVKPRDYSWRVTQRHTAEAINTHACTSISDCKMKDFVLAGAGASFPERDAVDQRIVAEIGSNTGKLIDAQSRSGCFFGCSNFLTPLDYTIHGITDPLDADGYPVLETGVAYTDNDKDGMDDGWEQQNGLNPQDADDHRGDINKNGYTNLEDFLNSLW